MAVAVAVAAGGLLVLLVAALSIHGKGFGNTDSTSIIIRFVCAQVATKELSATCAHGHTVFLITVSVELFSA